MTYSREAALTELRRVVEDTTAEGFQRMREAGDEPEDAVRALAGWVGALVAQVHVIAEVVLHELTDED